MPEAKNIISDDELQKVLQKELTEEFYLSLVTHTIFRLRKRFGVKGDSESIRDKAREFVQEIFESVFVTGTRKWNLDAYPELVSFLRSAIDSQLSNSFKSKRLEQPELDNEVFEQVSDLTSSIEDGICGDEIKKKIEYILAEDGTDDEVMMVFHCFFDGMRKKNEIRQELGISEAEFGKIWRRVQRKREMLKTKLSQL